MFSNMFEDKKVSLAKDLAVALTENAIPSWAAEKDGEIVVELGRKSLYFSVTEEGKYIPKNSGKDNPPLSSAKEVCEYIRKH